MTVETTVYTHTVTTAGEAFHDFSLRARAEEDVYVENDGTVLAKDVDYTAIFTKDINDRITAVRITPIGALWTGTSLRVYRDTLRSPGVLQQQDLQASTKYRAEVHENLYDIDAMRAIEMSDALSRAIQLPRGETADDLPSKSGNGGKAVVLKSDESGFEFGPSTDDISSAQTSATNAAASASAAAASETNASNAATAAAASASAAAMALSSAGFRLNFSSSTTDSDPGAGNFRLNSATLASVTQIFIDNEDLDGNTISDVLDAWDDYGQTDRRGLLTVKGNTDADDFAYFLVTGSVTDGSGYRKLTVSYIASGGTFSDGDDFVMSFAPSGADGVDGSGSLSNIVEDTTPQLGGALDAQGYVLNSVGSIYQNEQASAGADVAGDGQWWVKNDTPNVPMFTDDAGTDRQLATLDGAETLETKTLLGLRTTFGRTVPVASDYSDSARWSLETSSGLTARARSYDANTQLFGDPYVVEFAGDASDSQQSANTLNAVFQLAPGAQIQLTVPVYATGSPADTLAVRLGWYDSADSFLSFSSVTVSNSDITAGSVHWATLEATAPASAAAVRVFIYRVGTTTTGTWYAGAPRMEIAGSADGGGLTLITATDFSNDSLFDFTAFDAAEYDAYKIALMNAVPSSDGTFLFMRFSRDGGGTFDGGGSHYAQAARVLHANSSPTDTDQSDASASEFILGVGIGSGTNEDGWSGEITILGPHLSKLTRMNFQGYYINSSGIGYAIVGGGEHRLSGAVDGLRLQFGAGSLESGSVAVYGIKNA